MKWKSAWKKSFKWHRYFAWYPIDYGENVLWFIWVWRKRKCEFYECRWLYSKEKPPEI